MLDSLSMPVRDGALAWSIHPLADALAVGDASVVAARAPEGTRWVVVGPPTLRVNGDALVAGIKALADGDEICIDGVRAFFSAETLARVVPFPGSDRPVECPRCTEEIASGSPAVACPNCGLWHHQLPGHECWTYTVRCAACSQTTALDAGYRFDPVLL
jgi:hypothetical protein